MDNGHNRRGLNIFQSTLPVRGATFANHGADELDKFQSTLPVRGATKTCGKPCGKPVISIHAPRAGSDELAHDMV